MRSLKFYVHLLHPIVSAAISSSLTAEEVVLTPAADAGLFEGAARNNLGATESIASGTTGTGQNSRGLFRFDVAGRIPVDAFITSAELTLTVVNRPSGGGVDSTFALHRLFQTWGEGSQSAMNHGATAMNGESSWMARFAPDTLWAAPGGRPETDYSSAPSSTRRVSGLGSYAFPSTVLLVGDVQAWLDNPGENHGWILISQSEGTEFTARRFATLDHASAPFQPSLAISYQFPLLLVNPTVKGEEFSFEFQAKAGKLYAAQSRPSLDRNAPWTTFENVPTPTKGGSVTVTAPLTATNGFYRVVERDGVD